MADTDTLDGATVTLPKPGSPVSSPRPPVGDDRLSNALGLGDTKRVLATDRAKIDAMEPTVPKLTPPPPAPTPTDPLQAFGQPAMWIATFGSLLTRHSLTTAIQAGAGVMQAVHQQDMEAAKHAYDTWKLQAENATKMAKFEQDAYKAAISKYAADARAGEAEVKTLAAAFKNAALTQVYETEGMAGVKKYVLAHGKQTAQLGETSKGIEEHHTTQTTIAEGLRSDDPAKQAAALDAYADQIGKAQQGKGSSATSRMGSLTVGVRLRSIAEKLRSGDPALIAEAQQEASGMAEIGPGVLKAPKAASPQATITDDEANLAAEQSVKGDYRALQNWGRGAQGSANLVKIQKARSDYVKSHNLTGSDLAANDAAFAGQVASMRTAGQAGTRIDIGASELEVALPQALELSKKVWRSGFKPLDQLQQAIQGRTNDPDLLEFAQQNQAVINAYAATMSRGGASTVSAGERASELLATATNQEAYERQLDRLNKEVQQMKFGTDETKQHILNQISGRDTKVPAPTLTGVPKSGLSNIQVVGDKAAYDALPPGAHYRKAGDPEGSYRTKQ